MRADQIEQLTAEALGRITQDGCRRVALLGATPASARISGRLTAAGCGPHLLGIFDFGAGEDDLLLHPLEQLPALAPDLLIVCSDSEKERLLLAYCAVAGRQDPLPLLCLAGIAHQRFGDPLFAQLEAPALVPSYATGHPHTRVHLFQCLAAAAANDLRGGIVEFGAFKGGTTVWLAKAAQRLGLQDCPVLGFDSWAGFPPRRSVLDLYEHPRCEFEDLESVRAYCEPWGIELVAGDIAETYGRLRGLPLLLCFFDTDNYSPARAALELCVEQLVPGGAIVFDHFWTAEEYAYTVGERLAAREVLEGRGLLQLHGTGVFVKLR